MCLFHKWTKWEQYKVNMKETPGLLSPKEIHGMVFDVVEERQRRKCLKCGKVEDELVF